MAPVRPGVVTRRRLLTAAVVVATAPLVLTACQGASVAGSGSRALPSSSAVHRSSTSPLPSAVAASDATATATGTGSTGGGGGTGGGTGGGAGNGGGGNGNGGGGNGGGGSGGGNGGGSGGGGSTAPAFTSAGVQCVVTGHTDVPGRGSVATYSPRLSWQAVRATGVAVSVDNPYLVGSYGTFGATGTVDLGTGCYTDEPSHTVTFTTVGGSGTPATRTVRTPASVTRPTPVSSSPPAPGDPSADPSSPS